MAERLGTFERLLTSRLVGGNSPEEVACDRLGNKLEPRKARMLVLQILAFLLVYGFRSKKTLYISSACKSAIMCLLTHHLLSRSACATQYRDNMILVHFFCGILDIKHANWKHANWNDYMGKRSKPRRESVLSTDAPAKISSFCDRLPIVTLSQENWINIR